MGKDWILTSIGKILTFRNLAASKFQQSRKNLISMRGGGGVAEPVPFYTGSGSGSGSSSNKNDGFNDKIISKDDIK